MKPILFHFFLSYICIIFPSNVFAENDLIINEFLAKPTNNNPEWVEFYNPTGSTIDLSGYYFDDDANFSSDIGSDKFQLVGLLQPNQTCYWDLSSYLNNDGDSPSLFKNGQENTIDTYTYNNPQADLSSSRVPDGGTWQDNQSPSKSSAKCQDLAPQPTPTPSPSPNPSPSPTPTPTPIASPTPPPDKIANAQTHTQKLTKPKQSIFCTWRIK